jgi:hypothetical protein
MIGLFVLTGIPDISKEGKREEELEGNNAGKILGPNKTSKDLEKGPSPLTRVVMTDNKAGPIVTITETIETTAEMIVDMTATTIGVTVSENEDLGVVIKRKVDIDELLYVIN